MNAKFVKMFIFVVLMAIALSGCAAAASTVTVGSDVEKNLATFQAENGYIAATQTMLAETQVMMKTQAADLRATADSIAVQINGTSTNTATFTPTSTPTQTLTPEPTATQTSTPTSTALAAAPTNQPTQVSAPDNVPATSAESSTGNKVLAKQQSESAVGQWKVKYFTGATQLMRDFVFTDFVSGWKEFPNVDWPAGKFLAKDGLEYGQELSDFCQQDKKCDFPVAARSFRTITADYNISNIGECHEGGTRIGCALIIVNMGDVTASFRDQMVDTGHTITGLYWNGDEVDQAISAWASHIVYRMVNVPDNNPANPGANCSVPNGCQGVNIRFAIISGNEPLVIGESVVNPTK